jgi:hypothetical protein
MNKNSAKKLFKYLSCLKHFLKVLHNSSFCKTGSWELLQCTEVVCSKNSAHGDSHVCSKYSKIYFCNLQYEGMFSS